eukprot:g8751.t1
MNRLEQYEGRLVVDGLAVKTIMMPLWLAWFCITILSNLKTKISPLQGVVRDLVLCFLTIVALKLDGQIPVSWGVVFVIPWVFFAILVVSCFAIVYFMMKADLTQRPGDFRMTHGCAAIATSTCLHYFSFLAVYYQLQGESVSLDLVCFPSLTAWIMMWISALFTSMVMFENEREMQLVQVEDFGMTEIEQSRRHVASLTNTQIANIAVEMIRDEPKPSRILRVGHSSFRALEDCEHDEETRSVEEGRVPSTSETSQTDEKNCFICFDAEGTCVLLECGHGLYCRACANRLIVQRPHECPTCRRRITQIVEIDPTVRIGQTINVE